MRSRSEHSGAHRLRGERRFTVLLRSGVHAALADGQATTLSPTQSCPPRSPTPCAYPDQHERQIERHRQSRLRPSMRTRFVGDRSPGKLGLRAGPPTIRRPPALPASTSKSIGETGFEPATARPPARGMECRSVDRAYVCWVFCFRTRPRFAQFVPQIVPQRILARDSKEHCIAALMR